MIGFENMKKPFTQYQREIAFDRYYAMGESRDLGKLALGLQGTENFIENAPCRSTITKWSMEENWQERCTIRDIENAGKVQAKITPRPLMM